MKHIENKIAAIIIWYNPNNIGEKKIVSNINSYSKYFSKIYIIDNSKVSNKELSDKITKCKYIQNYNIGGIAGAQNRGCDAALRDGFEWAMTLDQDSYFQPEQIKKYIDKFNEYAQKDTSIKSFSLKIKQNTKTTSIIKLIQFNILSPIKRKLLGKHWHPKNNNKNKEVIEFPNEVIASGNIISLEAWSQVNKFDEYLFIDEVDHDFCHKLIGQNYKIIRFNDVYLEHFLGEKTISLFVKSFGSYNNFRLYYIYRNILIERFRYPEFIDFYNERLKKILFDTLINSIHPISHFYIFIKAYYDYKKYKSMQKEFDKLTNFPKTS